MMKVFRTQDGSETWSAGLGGTPYCKSVDVKFIVIDAPDKSTALKAVWDEAPSQIENLPKKEMRVDGYEEDRSLNISVIYEREDLSSDGSVEDDSDESQGGASFSFECSTGNVHVTRAISQRIAYGSQNAGGLIGWHGTKSPNEVDGVDIVTGTMRETYVKSMFTSALTNDYRKKIQDLTGSVNSSVFRGWKPGEVLFLGASFSANKGDNKVDVTFQFAIQPNESSYRVGGTDILVSKKGFEYVSAITDTQIINGVPNAVIDTVHINQVYRYRSFDGLGIGD